MGRRGPSLHEEHSYDLAASVQLGQPLRHLSDVSPAFATENSRSRTSTSPNLIVVPVSINHSGPYNFLLDTGTQMTMIDPALAAELHLAGSGEASVRTGGVSASASVAQADLVEAGTYQVSGLKVLVFDVAVQGGKSRDLRGVLGEDFLENFDLLIDNAHTMLCLDDSGRMRAEVKGRHVELLFPAAGDGPVRTPVVAVRLSDGMRPVRLELDSGADVCFLFDTSFMALRAQAGVCSGKRRDR